MKKKEGENGMINNRRRIRITNVMKQIETPRKTDRTKEKGIHHEINMLHNLCNVCVNDGNLRTTSVLH